MTPTPVQGNFLAVDPANGEYLYTGTQKPIHEMLVLRRGPGNSVRANLAKTNQNSFLAKYAIQSKGLKPLMMNPDAVVNGRELAVSPDGKKVAIVGLGGLGHMGVKLAHALGAEVTVLSQSLRKQADGERLGADHFYATSDPETFKKLERNFDLIINTVSGDMDWNQYLSLLKVDGSMVVVGAPEKPNEVASFALILGRRSLAGSAIGGIEETQEMLDFCGKHNVTSDIELIPIQKVNEAYERVLKSDVRYRFVIDMASLNAN